MDPARYASYELGRATVRFELARTIKERFGLNLAWLAGEAENMRGNWEMPTWVAVDNMLFSDAFNLHLRDHATTYMTKLDGPAIEEIGNLTQARGGLLSMTEIERIFDKYKSGYPEQLWDSLRLHYLRCAAEIALALQRGEINHLTKTSYSNKADADVKISPQWPALKKRLKKATEEVGLKPALAKALGVDPTQISQWLSDSKSSREPGGEYALQMLRWVEQRERKT